MYADVWRTGIELFADSALLPQGATISHAKTGAGLRRSPLRHHSLRAYCSILSGERIGPATLNIDEFEYEFPAAAVAAR